MPTETSLQVDRISDQQACYYAHELTRVGAVGEIDRLSATLFDAKVDLNPHQVDAALFAISNPLQKGVILADEVGLGKTIEAGLVLCQKWAERKRRLIIVSPAHIRKQWQSELADKFNLPSIVMDRKIFNQFKREGHINPFDCGKIIVISYGFAARMQDELRATSFDLVVFDEAHKLRNAYQPSRKQGQKLRWAFELRQKLLLTATPLQNSLLELYGLGWMIDEHLFGDKGAFQSRYCRADGDIEGLRHRLSQFCKRTLRKDCEYVRYTKRRAITHPFTQSQAEKNLYADVLAFMQQDESYAFPVKQRQLVEIVVFKALASSPQALAGTLRTMLKRLENLRDGMKKNGGDDYWDELAADEDLDIEDLVDEWDEDEDTNKDTQYVDGRLLAKEVTLLQSLIAQADSITCDSKSNALLAALKTGFAELAKLGAQRKALIFTESRKTQTFLAGFLEKNGYAGKVIQFNGSNNHPQAKAAYEQFKQRYQDTDRFTGSKAVDIRSALIEAFREKGEILLATEAAAEGVNLQFCSFVVNHDMPWNPQRVEQRIGRCHRYGQKFDVVVLNFLNQDNHADQRVHMLLDEKFNLFDGVFGASDHVLGTLENGIDFERRILDILKTCRDAQAIEAAFNRLQSELEDVIQDKMGKAKQQLMEHFDADVHEHLQTQRHDAELALNRIQEKFWKLAQWGLAENAKFDHQRFSLDLLTSPDEKIPSGQHRLISAAKQDKNDTGDHHLLRLSSPLGEWLLETAKMQELPTHELYFDLSSHPKKISMLEPFKGQCGWLRVERLRVQTDTDEDFLLVSGITDDLKSMDVECLERLWDLFALDQGPQTLSDAADTRLCQELEQHRQSILLKHSQGVGKRLQQLQDQLEQWAEDKVEPEKQKLEDLRNQKRQYRRQARSANTIDEQLGSQTQARQTEKRIRKQEEVIAQLQDKLDDKLDEMFDKLKTSSQQKATPQTVLTVKWKIV
ncbi:RNA polymerase-associated protein RapA [Poriferisphaera corsica]|uniref:RNA polymerase-associated protein RapA n=1 Tax=Poriferisphaera corsica TaxID=2528020 RepID=A0A517YS71_9BACT|nr:SNF2-related protein [Poriferisphaera corsica]QDU33061.1 RNA polymerase-associated protein RapA [Poriferisphaera corsica]